MSSTTGCWESGKDMHPYLSRGAQQNLQGTAPKLPAIPKTFKHPPERVMLLDHQITLHLLVPQAAELRALERKGSGLVGREFH